ncbi:MAG: NAD-dependent succinate-semialdehyde dehydrogenase [Alphaproteobacteria bacterium]
MQTSINPATGKPIQDYPEHTPQEVSRIIADVNACFQQFKLTSFRERSDYLQKVADVIEKNNAAYAELMALEMGKPIKEAKAELDKCASTARYFAQHGPIFLADQTVETEYTKSYVAFRPLGPILAIMPWNFPFWQVLRCAIPSLMAGNTVLLKHASNVPGCALALEDIFKEAGLPANFFRTLMIPARDVETVIASPQVAAVTLTGSTPAGKAVASMAGKYLKKTVLELGGSDAYLILEDADIDHAIKVCAASRLVNCGQSCVSAKRLVVVESLKEKFEQGVAEIFRQQKIGNPLDPATTMGPVARADLRDTLHDQVMRSIEQGARLLTGGEHPANATAFYPPTVLTDVKKGMAAYSEELFGPVAVIIPARNEADAIRISKDTPYGLGGAVFTRDLARGEQIARERIDSGACFVNMMVRSDARLPFGGIKESGYGRELSAFGIREFTNIKTIVIA